MTKREDMQRALVTAIRDHPDAQAIMEHGAAALGMMIVGLQAALASWVEEQGFDLDDVANDRSINACLSADLFNRLAELIAGMLGCDGCSTYAMESCLKRRIREGMQHSDNEDHIGPTEGTA